MWMVSMGDVSWVNYHYFVNIFEEKTFFHCKMCFPSKILPLSQVFLKKTTNTSNV
jgi:hypothetical protein